MKTMLTFGLALFLGFNLYAQDFVGAWLLSGTMPDGQPAIARMTFTADGAFSVDLGNDGSVEVTGKYTVNGNEVTILDDGAGDASCKVPATYRLTIEGDILRPELVKDDCEGRKGAMLGSKITRIK